ncbi:hypothetical protein E2C01_009789 [Portunus trituberculatus]|uniref:Uncharacterized protein n=1 Tax=Portunus trituberculatus TaxID=210409 RepID=A0A5B7D6Y7_PORTR|nr:hypothetical protein [Portunus trituberculatus]
MEEDEEEMRNGGGIGGAKISVPFNLNYLSSLYSDTMMRQGLVNFSHGFWASLATASRAASSAASSRPLNKPLASNDMPRPGGIASFMRLPVQGDTKGLFVVIRDIFSSVSKGLWCRVQSESM